MEGENERLRKENNNLEGQRDLLKIKEGLMLQREGEVKNNSEIMNKEVGKLKGNVEEIQARISEWKIKCTSLRNEKERLTIMNDETNLKNQNLRDEIITLKQLIREYEKEPSLFIAESNENKKRVGSPVKRFDDPYKDIHKQKVSIISKDNIMYSVCPKPSVQRNRQEHRYKSASDMRPSFNNDEIDTSMIVNLHKDSKMDNREDKRVKMVGKDMDNVYGINKNTHSIVHEKLNPSTNRNMNSPDMILERRSNILTWNHPYIGK